MKTINFEIDYSVVVLEEMLKSNSFVIIKIQIDFFWLIMKSIVITKVF